MKILCFCAFYFLAQASSSEILPVAGKPGNCPPAPGFGICVERCSSDTSCPEAQKCCSNGCGHTCQNPEHSEELLGSCPPARYRTEECLAVTFMPCTGDSDCSRTGQKCCSNGCGRTCMFPNQEPLPQRIASCQVVRPCPTGQECRIKNTGLVDCRGPYCGMEAKCFSTLTTCPEVRCNNLCPNGFLVDDNGCMSTSCTCSPVEIRTCEVPSIMACGSNERCEMLPPPRCPFPDACFPVPQCVDVCRGHSCAPGMTCRPQQVQCFRAPCYPVPECQAEGVTSPVCPPLVCDLQCARRKKDSNQCDVCECESVPSSYPTCEGMKCQPGYICDLQEEACACPLIFPLRCECPFVAKCVPANPPCAEWGCVRRCPYGYTADDTGCISRACRCKPGLLYPSEPCREYCSPSQLCELVPTQCEAGQENCFPRPECKNVQRVAKPGSCPRVTTPEALWTCYSTCSFDSVCPGIQKCCSTGCGHSCQNPDPIDWRTCPQVTSRPENCDRDQFFPCDSDRECFGINEKCCSSGCGFNSCMQIVDTSPTCNDVSCGSGETCRMSRCECPDLPETSCECPPPIPECIPDPVVKPGRCPRLDPNLAGICVEMCTSDNSCSGAQKCCSNGCGHTCQNPEPDQPPRGQCPTTTYSPDFCARARFIVCESDSQCRGTNERCCANGCGFRSCMPAVEPMHTCSDMICGPGEMCRMSRCECPNLPGIVCDCPPPVPECIPDEGLKSGRCPRVDPNLAGICVEMCSADSSCSGAQKCCSNGCGHTCQNPEPEVPPPGECPPASLTLEECALVFFQGCGENDECPRRGERCCFNGCGKTCLKTLPPPPSCSDIQCPANQICRLFDTPCAPGQVPCYPQPVCVQDNRPTNECNLPVVRGPCEAAFPRYAYNEGRCQLFVYGGCNGNGNNFETLEDCRQACERPVTPPIACPLCAPCPMDSEPDLDSVDSNGCIMCLCKPTNPPVSCPVCAPCPPHLRMDLSATDSNGCSTCRCTPLVPCPLCSPCPQNQLPDLTKDTNGCLTCRCRPSEIPIACSDCRPCPPRQELDMNARDRNGCFTCQCRPLEPIACPDCQPCPTGQMLDINSRDRNGCLNCQCRSSETPIVCPDCQPCQSGQILDPDSRDRNGCLSCQCRPVACPQCRPCPVRQILDINARDRNGCLTCQCRPSVPITCPNCQPCPSGQVLDTNARDRIGCVTCQCQPCPIPACLPCDGDWIRELDATDSRGCPTCGECRPLAPVPVPPRSPCERCRPCPGGFEIDSNLVNANGCPSCHCNTLRSVLGVRCPVLNCPLCSRGYVRNHRARDSLGCQLCACIPSSQAQPQPEQALSRPNNCRSNLCSPCLPGYRQDTSSVDSNGCTICRCQIVTSIFGTPCRLSSCPICDPGFTRNQGARTRFGCPICEPCRPGRSWGFNRLVN